MDLDAIRTHLAAAREAIGPEHPLSVRIQSVAARLTPDDPAWRNDAAGAQQELLAISVELGKWPDPEGLARSNGQRSKSPTRSSCCSLFARAMK